MRSRVPALAVLVLLAPGASAAPAPTACEGAAGLGCFYAPSSVSGDTTLLVYLRGWYGRYKGSVPAAKRVESARQAFATYGLGTLADKKGLAVLVLGSSSAGVTPEDVAELASESGLKFTKTILAAHSGGYVGLGKTLSAGVPASRILMLDDFYDTSGGLAKKLQEAVSKGASCAGYHTAQNRDSWLKVYKPSVACSVDDMGDDSHHDPTVARCLETYLTKPTCP